MDFGMLSTFSLYPMLHILINECSAFLRYFTSPSLPIPRYVDGFQGNAIPINAEAVVNLCIHRLSLDEEVDD